MPLQKQPLSLNFGMGLDTKADPKQVQFGSFLALQNSVFTTTGRLTKRNGFANITSLPNALQTTITTLNDNLIATGSDLFAFSSETNQWINEGVVQPVQLSVLPMVRVNTSQSSPDMAIAPTGLACLVYVDNSAAYYQVSNSATGQQIVARTALPATATNPRVFLLGQYFIITFMATVSAATHLQYIAIPHLNPQLPSTPTDIDTIVLSLTTGYDGFVTNNSLYLSWSGSSTTIRIRSLSSSNVVSPAATITGHTSTLMSVTADITASTPVIWVTFWDGTSTNGYTAAFNHSLNPVLAPTQIITGAVLAEITSVANSQLLTVIYDTNNDYASPYPNTGVRTDFLSTVTVTQGGTVGSNTVILRSVGLASKAFIDVSGEIYVLAAYGETNQPTYFLIDSIGNIYMRLAYSNGGGYEASQVLPTVSILNGEYYTPYQYADFLAAVNKGTALPSGTPTNGIYTQTGINLAEFSINSNNQYSSEIAGSLFLTGGQLWQFDGVKPVEDGFQVWPENIANTTASTGGFMSAQIYYYVFCYEWTDNAGNLIRSAPSIPLEVDLSASMTMTNEVTLYVPTLRLTYKLAPNPVRIVGYRWSTAQQVYYQFTSLTSPTTNNTMVDFVSIVDTLADASILGNVLLYTTGDVVENIAPPACIASCLFDDRLWLIDAEDRNLLWYSKQVIEATPVEMSDLFTIYVAPSTGAQGSTGPLTALSAMDDKLIMFKADAIYYLNGTGPDNTGSNSGYSQPIYITSSVGCSNPNSIVLMPNGIMFQSDKGIWLLGRDLSTNYIGSGVEAYNGIPVESAQTIPGTTQVRFILNDGTTLMYDYYFNQWGTFSNIDAISATLYQGLHTYLNEFGDVYQETPGIYLDGSIPVLMSFTTSWVTLAGIQGYERFYACNLLGTYFTPFKLNVQIAYDYNPSPVQAEAVAPDNYAPNWGSEAQWGSGGPWGGSEGNVFTARVFPQKQKTQSFQLIINEIYDPTFGVPAGQGLNLSGVLLLVGIKRGSRTQSAAKSFG